MKQKSSRKRMSEEPKPVAKGESALLTKWVPWIVLVLIIFYLGSAFRNPYRKSEYSLDRFGQLPVLSGGRLKPIDSIARNALLLMSGKQTLRVEGEKKSATEWLLDALMRPEVADTYRVFEINDPDVLGIMGIQSVKRRHFTFNEIKPHLELIEFQANMADQREAPERSRFQRAVLVLQDRLVLYQRIRSTLRIPGDKNVSEELTKFEPKIQNFMAHHMNPNAMTQAELTEVSRFLEKFQFMDRVAYFFPLPVHQVRTGEVEWVSLGRGVLNLIHSDQLLPGIRPLVKLGEAYHNQDPAAFNQALTLFRSDVATVAGSDTDKPFYEYLFNHVQPFYKSIILYTLIFILTFLSWLIWPRVLNRTTFLLLILTFAVHTIGLVARMWLQGRPPVTNLYSSAIFVGWVSVGLGIILEWLFRRGIGSMLASVIGLSTLIVAQNLSTQGDTLEMMRAVLDSNFWLATHVITITVGYGSTFISGFIGILFLIRRLWDPKWNKESAELLERMVYGIVCFSTFFSFIGTVLGGIWADQSWGRFWGWDPKENGALMIVLWNVFILHARWSKVVSPKGIMMMAVFGNVITALSWFGVNMLGIGLHSYGFMDKAFLWLMIFVVSQMVIIGLGFIHPLPRPIRKNPA